MPRQEDRDSAQPPDSIAAKRRRGQSCGILARKEARGEAGQYVVHAEVLDELVNGVGLCPPAGVVGRSFVLPIRVRLPWAPNRPRRPAAMASKIERCSTGSLGGESGYAPTTMGGSWR